MLLDSYLENQRRRHLRDSQGYYFPYKKYTLKDYKDLQKLNNQNPFADVQEPIIDRVGWKFLIVSRMLFFAL